MLTANLLIDDSFPVCQFIHASAHEDLNFGSWSFIFASESIFRFRLLTNRMLDSRVICDPATVADPL